MNAKTDLLKLLEEQMINSIMALVIMISGIYMIIFHKSAGQKTAEFWAKITPSLCWGVKGYQISYLIGGIIFVVFGLLALTGIIKFK